MPIDDAARNRAIVDRASSQARSYAKSWIINSEANPDFIPIGTELRLNDCLELVNLQDEQIYKAPEQTLGECPSANNDIINKFAKELLTLAAALGTYAREKKDSDRRFHRLHLIVEEVGELAEAMSNQNEIEALDSLADLQVVTLGTAGRMRLPICPAFLEVMLSNFTKVAQSNDPDAFRIREKGEGYRPPRMEQVFQMHVGRPPYSASIVNTGEDG